jgi:hypothetical protein
MTAAEEHDAIYARHIAEAKRIYSGMSREELLKWQSVVRARRSNLHSDVACLEVIFELLKTYDLE